MKSKKSWSRPRRPSPKKKILLAMAGIAAAAFVLVGLQWADIINLPFFSGDKPSSDVNDGSGINYGPPTAEELRETEEFKDSQADSTPAPTTPPAGQKTAVTPVITSWGQNPTSKVIEATGFAPVIEAGGTCTLTASKGPQKVTVSISATSNAQNVSCGLMTIARDKLTPGTWTLTLSYSSASSEGTSGSQTQEVL